MNKETALSFYLACDDIEECWEERFLAHLEFFRTKVAVPKLYRSRISKLRNDWHAAEILMNEQFPNKLVEVEVPAFQNEIFESVKSYYASLAEIHGGMHRNPNPHNVIFLAESKLKLTKHFTQFISEQCDWDVVKELSIGIEPDPMRIFESIRNFESQGVKRFDQLGQHSLEPLVLEVKRWLRISEQFKD